MNPASAFDTIESAREFVELFEQAIAETRGDVQSDIELARDEQAERRLEALLLVLYKLERLEFHVSRSARLLNDLRRLRDVLFAEGVAQSPRIRVPQAESPAEPAA